MKILTILGTVLKAAVPAAAATVIAGPVAGVLVGVGTGAGAGTKVLGKIVGDYTGTRPHKVASPIAAVGLPALLANWLAPETLQQLCELVARLCEKPESLAVIPGLVAWLAHQVWSNVSKVAGSKS